MKCVKTIWCFVLGMMPAFVGCGGEGLAGAVPAGGTVTVDGKPIANATVSFTPTGQGGRAASGLTESDGSFKLTTIHAGDGVMPGKYKISVSKVVQPDAPKYSSQEEAMKAMQEQMKKSGQASLNKSEKLKDEIPSKYANPDSSGLDAEVVQGGNNDFKFDLKTGS